MKNLIMNHKKLVTTCLFCALVVCLLTATFLGASAFAASGDTQTSGKFTFTDNSLSTGELLISIADDSRSGSLGDTLTKYSKTYVAIKEGDTVVYSETSTWDYDASFTAESAWDLDQKITFAKQAFSIDTATLSGNGTLKANTAYTIYAEATTFEEAGMQAVSYNVWYIETGTGYNASFSFTLEAASELPTAPTKTGYTFTGWYTDEACTQLYEQEYITGNVTLYAGWRANTYTIAFNGNGKSSGTMENLGMTYDTAANLTANAFKRSGYVFKGWSTTATGPVVYADEASVKNLTAVDGATVTLYAVWEQVSYTVHFNANGGEGSMNDQTHTIDVAKKLTNNGFTRTGYTFKGWATSASGNVSYTNMQSVTNIGSAGATVQLYAVWEINKLTIKYNANEGTGSIANQTINYGESATLTLVSGHIQREYYRFVGWATEKDGAVVYKDGETINYTDDANKTITLYAVWERVMCTVTFIVDGEIYAIVEVAAGTPTSDLYKTADVSTMLYEMEGDYPN